MTSKPRNSLLLVWLLACVASVGNAHSPLVTLALNSAGAPLQELLKPRLESLVSEALVALLPMSGDDVLKRWLQNLVVVIPDTTTQAGGFNIVISDGSCTHFSMDDIQTTSTGKQVHIKAVGLAASCTLQWSVHSILIPSIGSTGKVVAAVSDSDLSGPFAFAQRGNPPLPSSVTADGCNCNIEVTDLQFSGSISAAILSLLSGTIKSFISTELGGTKGVVCKELDIATGDPATHFFGNSSLLIRQLLRLPHSPRYPSSFGMGPSFKMQPKKDFADIGYNSGMVMVQKLLQVLTNPSSDYSINKLLGNGTVSLKSGGLVFPISKVVNVSSIGVMNITVQALSLKGLNTWTQINLESLNNYQGNLTLGLGNPSADVSMKLQVSPKPGSAIHGGMLEEDFDFNVGLKDVSMGMSFFTVINQASLGSFTIDQLPHAGCLSQGVQRLILNTSMALPSTSVSLVARGPSSRDTLDEAIDKMLNAFLGMTLDQFALALDAVVAQVVAVFVQTGINDKIVTALADASKPLSNGDSSCPAPLPSYSSESASVLFQVIAAVCLISIVAVALVCPFVEKYRAKQKQAREVQVPTNISLHGLVETGSIEQSPGLLGVQPEALPAPAAPADGPPDQRQKVESSKVWDCLAFHPRVPPALRWGLPLLTLAVIFSLAASNCMIATTVNASIIADGKPMVHLPPVFGFSLVSSVKDMWDGGIYALAALIVGFSGLWPYGKLGTMLLCWFAPSSRLSPGWRMWLLEFLDLFGKWSLVDAFVMVLFMVAFQFNLRAEDSVFATANGLFKEADATASFHINVEAGWGFHLFLIATIGSLVCGHMMTACNRYALQIGEFSQSAVDQEIGCRKRLCNALRPEGYWPGKMFAYGPVVAMSFSLVLLCVGMWIDVFSFTFEGLGGYMLHPDDRVRAYSVISLGMAVPGASVNPGSFGVRWLQVVFLLFAAFVMVAYLAILIVLWCAPLSPKLQMHFFVASQVLSAWSGVDVFVVSIMAAVLEISQFVVFIIGDKCDLINRVLEKTIGPELPGGVEKCFQIETSLEAGFYILLLAAVVSTVGGYLMIKQVKMGLGMESEQINSFVMAD